MYIHLPTMTVRFYLNYKLTTIDNNTNEVYMRDWIEFEGRVAELNSSIWRTAMQTARLPLDIGGDGTGVHFTSQQSKSVHILISLYLPPFSAHLFHLILREINGQMYSIQNWTE